MRAIYNTEEHINNLQSIVDTILIECDLFLNKYEEFYKFDEMFIEYSYSLKFKYFNLNKLPSGKYHRWHFLVRKTTIMCEYKYHPYLYYVILKYHGRDEANRWEYHHNTRMKCQKLLNRINSAIGSSANAVELNDDELRLIHTPNTD